MMEHNWIMVAVNFVENAEDEDVSLRVVRDCFALVQVVQATQENRFTGETSCNKGKLS